MSLKITVPDQPWSETVVTLGGQTYTLVFRYNERDERFRLDLYSNETPILLGVKIVESTYLLSKYKLEEFKHGDIFCLRFQKDFSECSRNNLGVGKSYELIYLSDDEINNIGEG